MAPDEKKDADELDEKIAEPPATGGLEAAFDYKLGELDGSSSIGGSSIVFTPAPPAPPAPYTSDLDDQEDEMHDLVKKEFKTRDEAQRTLDILKKNMRIIQIWMAIRR